LRYFRPGIALGFDVPRLAAGGVGDGLSPYETEHAQGEASGRSGRHIRMTEQQVIGFSALAIVVVGMVVYRVIWFIRREKRRNSGVVWFKPK
jgi:hypothetical protein